MRKYKKSAGKNTSNFFPGVIFENLQTEMRGRTMLCHNSFCNYRIRRIPSRGNYTLTMINDMRFRYFV